MIQCEECKCDLEPFGGDYIGIKQPYICPKCGEIIFLEEEELEDESNI